MGGGEGGCKRRGDDEQVAVEDGVAEGGDDARIDAREADWVFPGELDDAVDGNGGTAGSEVGGETCALLGPPDGATDEEGEGEEGEVEGGVGTVLVGVVTPKLSSGQMEKRVERITTAPKESAA
jgi:hypothetical protein